MNVTVDNLIGVFQNLSGMVGEDDLNLTSAVSDQIAVVFNIIYTGERMNVASELGAVFSFIHDLGIGIDAGIIQLIFSEQLIAYLITRI